MIVLILAAACAGVLLGYAGEYVEYRNEVAHGAAYSTYAHEWVCLPAPPGSLMASCVRGFDYRLTEAWELDAHRAAFLNGVVFGGAVLMALAGVSIFKRVRASDGS